MKTIASLFLGAAACALALSVAAEPREIAATSDTFVAEGVVLAWGVLRAGASGEAVVDVRVAVDPMTYPRLAVVGRDPAKSIERTLATSPTAGLTDVRLRRATIDRYPRTEFRFFATAKAEPGEAPALVVLYAGMPPGVPEVENDARLDATLGERVARAKATAKPR